MEAPATDRQRVCATKRVRRVLSPLKATVDALWFHHNTIEFASTPREVRQKSARQTDPRGIAIPWLQIRVYLGVCT